MNRKALLIASFLGFTAIILGAFGAHALKKILTLDQLSSFETGVKYQMYHALFLLFIAQTSLISEKTKKTILWLVVLGTLFFSGSIYLLSLQDVFGTKLSFLGPITPIGGTFLIISWILLFFNALKQKTNN